MSKNHRNRDERMKSIRRYLDGKMSDIEQNDFERKLQRDPFEEEALEGFSRIKSTELNADIKSLRSDLKGRVRKRTPLYFRIAAAIVVLLAISSLLLVRELREPVGLVSDNVHSIKELPEVDKTEAVKNLDETMPGEPDQTVKDNLDIQPELARRSESENLIEEDVTDLTLEGENVILFEIVSDDIVTTDSIFLDMEVKESVDEAVIIEEKVDLVQAKKSREMALPARAQEKTTGAVAGVSVVESSKLEDEIVIDISEDEVDLSSDSEPLPLGGIKEFKKYLETDQIFPEEWTKTDREIVKIDLTIDNSGKIVGYKIIKSPGSLFTEETKRLIKEGPPWKPAIKSGERIKGSVRIRLIFQR